MLTDLHTLLLSANEFKLKLFLVNLVKLDNVAKGNHLTTGGNYFTTASFCYPALTGRPVFGVIGQVVR